MATRADIVAAAESWLGVKWQHQGRTRHGIDCIGLPAVVALELGIVRDLPRADYPRRPDGTLVRRLRDASALTEIRVADAAPGDIAVFSRAGAAYHCGILCELHGQPAVIHAYASARRVVRETVADAATSVGTWTHAFRFPYLRD